MKDSDFMTNNNYIYLPTKRNPKVALAIDNEKISTNSFELYNPFSKKAITLKKIVFFVSIKLNLIMKLFSFRKKQKSEFIKFLEEKLEQEVITSLYYATAKDKIVLQVQSLEGKVLGYLKYPTSHQGYKNLKREIRAYKALSKIGLIDKYIFKDRYNDKPFIFLHKLEGEIKELSPNNVSELIKSFYKEDKFKLIDHPRIERLRKQLIRYELYSYLKILINLLDESQIEYHECYEHGDFAPWNIIEDNNNFIPFDFEYFIKRGLEYFDLIKYYYQIGTLLKHYDEDTLISYIFDNLDIEEKEIIFKIYLIKEIAIKTKENHSYEFEKNLLLKMEKNGKK